MSKASGLNKFFVYGILLILGLVSVVSGAEEPKWIGAFFVKGKVGLKWQAVADAGQYRIMRASGGGEFVELTVVEETQYFDTDLTPGTTYSYKIAVTAADGSTAESEVKKVTIPGSSAGEFKAPVWSGLRFDRNQILLRWDPVPGAIAYNVYRSVTPGAGYEVVGNTTSDRFADRDGMEFGVEYYYVVTALNEEFEETPYSEERSLKYGQSAEERAAAEEAEQIVLEPLDMTFLFEIKSAGSNGDMNQPTEIAANSAGDLYVVDALNGRVHCFANDGKYKFSFGEHTPVGEESAAPAGTFSYPFGLFIDSKDQVWVSDVKNNDIQAFTADGKFVKRIKVATEPGAEDFRPNSIHVYDDGRILSTDAGNHRIVILDQSGKVLKSIGSRGSEPGQFIFPDGLTVLPDGTICVVDVINCRIQEFDPEGNFIRAFGEPGQTAGTFGRPKAITFDDQGHLWVSDAMANLVQVFTVEGEVKSAFSSFERDDLFLATPRGVLVRDGRFYVVNRLPHQVLVFQLN